MFRITMGKGFQMTFENGLTVSVQWGDGNYCDNYSKYGIMDIPAREIDLKSSNAEIAVWDADGKWVTKEFFPDIAADVVGRLTADEVGNLITRVMLQVRANNNTKVEEE